MHHWQLLLILYTLLHLSLASLTVLEPPGISAIQAVPIHVPDIRGSVWPSVQGRLVLSISYEVNYSLAGMLVFSPEATKLGNPGFARAIRNMQASGALALIAPHDAVFPGIYAVNSIEPEDKASVPRAFPVVDVGNADALTLLSLLETQPNVTVILTNDDWPLDWEDMLMGFWTGFFQVTVSPFVGSALVIASWKLFKFLRSGKSKITLASICLTFEILANLIRYAWLLASPIYGSTRITMTAAHLLATGHLAFSLSSTLLICFYWFELMSRTKTALRTPPFLSKLRIPFIIIVIFLFAIEFTSSTMRANPGNDLGFLTILAGAMYVILTLATAIFFLWNGYRILKFFKNAAHSKVNSASKRLIRSTRLLVASGALSVPLIAGEAIALTDGFYTAGGFYSLWYLVFASTSIVSLMHVLAFHPPKTSGSLSSRGSTEGRGSGSGEMQSPPGSPKSTETQNSSDIV